ncbi:MAG TPA: hypothetical protein V6D18_20965 [Thermosynechococcaceae cyanobacterium]|jgi:hypothetical protein
MSMKLEQTVNKPSTAATEILNPADVLEMMIELRFQLREIEEQIQALQPAFFAACLALNLEKTTLQRATIARRLTQARWDYSDSISEQEAWLKQLKQQFQHSNEPTGGREVTWMVKLLLVQSQLGSMARST